MFIVLKLLLAIAAAGDGPIPTHHQTILMDKIERQVVMPKGAEPLSRYERYYYRRGGEVVGIYVFGPRASGRRWVADRKNAPLVFDGGCSVVNVVFVVASGDIRTHCNGLA